jgi:hypothetical protein
MGLVTPAVPGIEVARPRQQLLDLLGTPTYEGEKAEVTYGLSYGTTTFFFEDGRLKSFITPSEPTFWHSYPRQSLGKRLWYKAVRWSGKLKRL